MSVPETMRAVVLYDIDDIRIEQRPIPQLQPGEMLVRTMAAGICTGDILPWYIRRKAPCVLGHEPSGIVAAVADDGANEHAFHVGDRVFVHHHAPCFECDFCERGDYVQCAGWRASRIDPGAMAEYFRVPMANLRDTLHLPPRVGFADGSLVEPLACVVKSLRRGGVTAGDDVYVIGLGVMGLMHVLAAQDLGARVFGSDFIEGRRDRATQLGATTFHPDDVATKLPNGARVVICGPGVPAALDAAVAAVAPGGTVVMFTPFEPGTPVDHRLRKVVLSRFDANRELLMRADGYAPFARTYRERHRDGRQAWCYRDRPRGRTGSLPRPRRFPNRQAGGRLSGGRLDRCGLIGPGHPSLPRPCCPTDRHPFRRAFRPLRRVRRTPERRLGSLDRTACASLLSQWRYIRLPQQ